MLPIKTEKSNAVYLGPTPDIMDLPCEVERHKSGLQRVVYSVWELDEGERQAIAQGENIKLGVWTPTPIPPVSLQVVGERRFEEFGESQKAEDAEGASKDPGHGPHGPHGPAAPENANEVFERLKAFFEPHPAIRLLNANWTNGLFGIACELLFESKWRDDGGARYETTFMLHPSALDDERSLYHLADRIDEAMRYEHAQSRGEEWRQRRPSGA